MAYNNAEGRAEYTAVSGQTDFSFVFKIYEDKDLVVWLTPTGQEPDDVLDKLILGADYTVVVNGDNGGTLTLMNAASAGDYVTLVRTLEATRDTEYQLSGELRSEVLNSDQNYQTYLISDQKTRFDKVVRLPENSQGTSGELPAPVGDAYLRWKADGSQLENDTTVPDNVLAAREYAYGTPVGVGTTRKGAQQYSEEASTSALDATQSASGATQSASGAAQSATNAEQSYQNTLIVEQDVINQGTTQVARVASEGDTQVQRVIDQAAAELPIAVHKDGSTPMTGTLETPSIRLRAPSGGSINLVPTDGTSDVDVKVPIKDIAGRDFVLGGDDYSWVDETNNRVSGVTYTNTTGKPIELLVGVQKSNPNAAVIEISVDGHTSVSNKATGSTINRVGLSLIVPDGSTYIAVAMDNLTSWLELK